MNSQELTEELAKINIRIIQGYILAVLVGLPLIIAGIVLISITELKYVIYPPEDPPFYRPYIVSGVISLVGGIVFFAIGLLMIFRYRAKRRELTDSLDDGQNNNATPTLTSISK